jgi:hypothetical protein
MAVIPISIARRRAALAKRGLVFGSVLAFAATIGLARSSHPATAASTAPSTIAAPAIQTAPGGFGQAQVSPSASSQTPSVSTGAS